MPNEQYLIPESQVPAMNDADSVKPKGAPAPPVPNAMPPYFEGSIAPQLQQNVDFSGTEVASPMVPKYSLMPFGNQASALTNAAAQSTASKTIPTPSPSSAYYQIVAEGGARFPQRNILNFINANVVDDSGAGSTDVTLEYQTVQQAGVAVTQRPILNFLTPITVVDDSGNNSSDVSVPVFVGDSGSGGVMGLVPAPPAGSAAASEFLSAGGTWQKVTASVAVSMYVNSVGVSVDRLSFVNGVQVVSSTWTYKINGVAATG